jgi:DNA-binding transcriptional regulator YhcF (GntR family)
LRDLVYLPVELIKKADNEYWDRSLAYFVRLKSLYKNNTHYNFSLRSLAARVGCSPACLSFHLKVLVEKGIVCYHRGNVTFAGLKKLQSMYKRASIGVPVNSKHQVDFLRGQIIRFNLSAQRHNIKKSGIHKRKTKSVPFTRTEKTESCYVGLSAAGIGRLFGVSSATGGRIREKLGDFGLLSVKRVFSLLFSGISERDYRNMKWAGNIPIYSFWKQGRVLVERRTELEYLLGT